MNDNKSSSLDDLSLLDPDEYIAIADTIPTVEFVDDGLEVIAKSVDVEEDDFSDYVRCQATDNTQLSSSQLLQVSSSHADTESVSPSCSFSTLPSLDCEYDLPDWLFEAEDMGVIPEGVHKNPPKTADESLGRIFLSTLKEEIRLKIQLKRVTSGQEELKVDFSPPGSTICYNAVKKRNEVREKNKEYAKQSRDRLKSERMKQEEDNQRLKRRNKKLKHDIINLKQEMLAADDFLQRHHRDCPVCFQVENTCSICTKTRPRTFLGVNRSQKQVKAVLKPTEAGDLDPVPGPSALSKVKTNDSRSEESQIEPPTISSDVHATQHDLQCYKEHERLIRPKVKLYEDLTSSVGVYETKDDKGEDTAMKGKRPANVMDVFWGENDINYDTKLNLISTGKRRLIVSDPTVQFHETVPSVVDHTSEEDHKDHETEWDIQLPMIVPKPKAHVYKDMDIFLTENDMDLNIPWTLSSPTISSSSEIPDHEDLAFSDNDSITDKDKDPLTVWMVKPPAIVPNPKRHNRERLESTLDYFWAEDMRDKETLFPGKQHAFVSSKDTLFSEKQHAFVSSEDTLFPEKQHAFVSSEDTVFPGKQDAFVSSKNTFSPGKQHPFVSSKDTLLSGKQHAVVSSRDTFFSGKQHAFVSSKDTLFPVIHHAFVFGENTLFSGKKHASVSRKDTLLAGKQHAFESSKETLLSGKQHASVSSKDTLFPGKQDAFVSSKDTLLSGKQHAFVPSGDTFFPGKQHAFVSSKDTFSPGKQDAFVSSKNTLLSGKQHAFVSSRDTFSPGKQHAFVSSKDTLLLGKQHAVVSSRDTFFPGKQHAFVSSKDTLFPVKHHAFVFGENTLFSGKKHASVSMKDTLLSGKQHAFESSKETLLSGKQHASVSSKDTLFPGKQHAFVSSSTEKVNEGVTGSASVVLDILDHG